MVLMFPKRFQMRWRFGPPITGFVEKADWTCHARKGVTRRDRTIGTVRVK